MDEFDITIFIEDKIEGGLFDEDWSLVLVKGVPQLSNHLLVLDEKTGQRFKITVEKS